MNTPITDGEIATQEPISGVAYWCTFTDSTQTKIKFLISDQKQLPPPFYKEAILLSQTDSRVQDHFHIPHEGRSIQKLTLESLEDLYRLAHQFDTGIPKPLYRGQNDYNWSLQTRIERNVPEFVLKETGLEVYEYRVLAEAHKRLHHFLDKLPDEDDLLSWLALLRHHGVPTRLLDVTRSLFIACYFAIHEAKPGTDSAVWIFNRQSIDIAFGDWSRNANETWLRESPLTIAQYNEPYYWPFPKKRKTDDSPPTIDTLRHPQLPGHLDFAATLNAAMQGYVERPGVAVAEPFWLSRRMDVQQGAFLIPFNIREDFQVNLFSFLALSSDEFDERQVPTDPEELFQLWAHAKVIKLRIPESLQGLLKVKLESMNLRDLTLFPDIEGAMAHIAGFVPIEGK